LGYDYTVKPNPGIGKREDKYALYNAGALEIEYDSTLHRQMQESSILHEIIEAINYHLQLNLKHAQIMALETGLYGALNDSGVDLGRLIS
jgi:hypothetical protein